MPRQYEMPFERVLALDPGEQVGWAAAKVDKTTGELSELKHGIKQRKTCALDVFDALRDGRYDRLVIEDWRLYRGMEKTFTGSNFPSVRLIGALELAAALFAVPVTKQGASIKKTALQWMSKLEPELAELAQTPGAHNDRHDMDAILHLCFYTIKTYRSTNA